MSDPLPVESRAQSPRAWVAGGLFAAVGVFAVGALGGFYAAQQSSPAARAAGGEHAGEAAARRPALDPRTLENLGVEVAEVAPTEFVRTREVPAVVEGVPGRRRACRALVGGVVTQVLVEPGQKVDAGAVVAHLRRDPFPRATLALTEAVLRPLNEEYHGTVATLRVSAQALSLARGELERVRRIMEEASGGSGARVPGKVEIDLQNEERRAERALENARQEAARHGLLPDEIAAVEAGGHGPSDLPPAERVLARNRLWSPDAQAVLAALPEPVRALPYATAVVAELAGSHALTPELARAVEARPRLAAAFLDVAGLLQQGLTLPGLLALEESGSLDALVPLRAAQDAPDWDVVAVDVLPGARVEAGAPVVVLEDRRVMWLRLAPAGPDLDAVATAVAARDRVAAEPLVAGSGPALEGLEILRLDTAEREAAHAAAYALAGNEALADVPGPGGARFRSWRLRDGQRYLVLVPSERLAGRFVLPAGAVTPRGADSVVLLEDGSSFRPVAVRVEHLDARVAVVAADGALFPGDRVVVRGAYALSLALQAGSGGGAAGHAGHQH